ncbi:MAG: hypothetical protein A2622_04695 [Bdellovibrionales bacterium RIFCSPHIGHO2_01_FULL_40_29]|nr:MAG: hypothetical protein A2622_04695 [Bdellovibrionales bacterium RIFCSPHIGHO2_01_FULL_40_29]OFZ34768.1 MAG: hypothetical protein A3D17_10675 [Bdellovibrionales bacterium RIFCSPHIGHO2_02_FULL_40_15]
MKRILLCDDSNMMLTILTKRLTDAGFQIVGKGMDGEEGYKLFCELKPDLMLLDVTMPNKDGRQCLSDILAAHPTASIIMVSALADEELQKSCIQAGAKAFITKSNLSTVEDFDKHVASVIHSIFGDQNRQAA